MEQVNRSQRTAKEYVGIALRGFCMGAADVVPGVSGGTMAFITGIYEELVLSIRSIDLEVIGHLLTFRFKAVFRAVRWQFLLSVLVGILLAVFTLSRAIAWLLDHRAVYLWSFFFGLVVASVFTVTRQISAWRVATGGAAGLATVGAFVIVGLVPVETPDAAWFLFLSGAIAICAMILPGISGSFILVLLGKYQYILGAVNGRDFLTLGIFAAGAGIGILSFAQVLSWVFKRYHDLTIAVLTGLMVGSLRKIWPWKETVSILTNRHGKQIPLEQLNSLPPGFTAEVAFAVGLGILGFAVVIGLDRLVAKQTRGGSRRGVNLAEGIFSA